MVVIGYEGVYGELLGFDTLESTTEGYGDKELLRRGRNLSP